MVQGRTSGTIGAVSFLVLACASKGVAQEVFPTPPAPSKWQIGLSVKYSKPDFPQLVHAPNVVSTPPNDVGFRVTSPFGGPSNTPALSRLAQDRLRHTQFHTTALCSPAQAAPLTGRNQHFAQWRPAVFIATRPAEPYPGIPNYNFDCDMADQAVKWARDQKAVAPAPPYFLYYAPGLTHSPHRHGKERQAA